MASGPLTFACHGSVAHPDIVVDLSPPSPFGRRTINAVAHRPDDRAAFVAVLEGLRAGHD